MYMAQEKNVWPSSRISFAIVIAGLIVFTAGTPTWLDIHVSNTELYTSAVYDESKLPSVTACQLPAMPNSTFGECGRTSHAANQCIQAGRGAGDATEVGHLDVIACTRSG
jgi:hypothetical protein